MKDEDGWRQFFFGQPTNSSKSRPAAEVTEGVDAPTAAVTPTTTSTPARECIERAGVIGNPPTLRLLLQFDQVCVTYQIK